MNYEERLRARRATVDGVSDVVLGCLGLVLAIAFAAVLWGGGLALTVYVAVGMGLFDAPGWTPWQYMGAASLLSIVFAIVRGRSS